MSTASYRGVADARVAARGADAAAILSWLVAAMALAAAGVGLFWDGGEAATTYRTLRGESVETYGPGVYDADSVFRGAGFRGTDVVTLFLGIPFLLGAVALHRRGSVRGTLLLGGTLAYFLYVYASLALGATYNELFLLYVALLAASAFGLASALRTVDISAFDPAHLPRRGVGIFMLASGVVTAAIWLVPEVLPALATGDTPDLDGYTTLVTHVLDLGLVVPTVLLSGVLILRRNPLGYAIAVPLLVLEASLLPMIVLQTVSQLEADVSLTAAEIVGPIASFCIFASLAVAVLVAVLRRVPSS